MDGSDLLPFVFHVGCDVAVCAFCFAFWRVVGFRFSHVDGSSLIVLAVSVWSSDIHVSSAD